MKDERPSSTERPSDDQARPAALARELGRASERLELVLDDIQDYAVILLDLKGRVASWNAGAERLKGYAAPEAIGLLFERLFTPEDIARGEPGHEMDVALRDGVYQGAGQRVRKDGSRFEAEVVLRRINDERGNPLGFVKVTRDITERKKLEALEEIRMVLQERVVAIVSHDLRSPMSVIRLSSALLLRADNLTDTQRRAIMRIVSSSDRAMRLISDLLDYSQARFSGAISIRPQPFDLHALLERCAEELRFTHPGRRLVVEAFGEQDVVWDADRIEQVLVNLVRNALAHGSQDAPVRVAARGASDAVVLDVHNEGEPIPPVAMVTLFMPFAQAETGRATPGSIGLGLFIVQQIVLAHGGTIQVRSNSDEGTTFSVTLPRRALPSPAPRP